MNYNVILDNFEGPMDLLLHLIKESKMDIYEVNISLIIEQYLEIINQTKELNIDIASNYLVMASTLIYLKSRKLINQTDDEPDMENDITSEEDLKQKLIMYEKYKSVTSVFDELIEKRSDILTKFPEDIREYLDEEVIVNSNLNLDALINAYNEYQSRIELKKPKNTKITRKEISMSERIRNIRSVLKEKKKVLFTELFESFDKPFVVVTFLSVLSMCSNNEIFIKQDNNFSDIYLESRA